MRILVGMEDDEDGRGHGRRAWKVLAVSVLIPLFVLTNYDLVSDRLNLCVFCLAKRTGRVEFCYPLHYTSDVPAFGTMHDYCVHEVAIRSRDTTICDRLVEVPRTSSFTRQSCLTVIAKEEKKVEVCRLISGTRYLKDRTYCENEVRKTIEFDTADIAQ